MNRSNLSILALNSIHWIIRKTKIVRTIQLLYPIIRITTRSSIYPMPRIPNLIMFSIGCTSTRKPKLKSVYSNALSKSRCNRRCSWGTINPLLILSRTLIILTTIIVTLTMQNNPISIRALLISIISRIQILTIVSLISTIPGIKLTIRVIIRISSFRPKFMRRMFNCKRKLSRKIKVSSKNSTLCKRDSTPGIRKSIHCLSLLWKS